MLSSAAAVVVTGRHINNHNRSVKDSKPGTSVSASADFAVNDWRRLGQMRGTHSSSTVTYPREDTYPIAPGWLWARQQHLWVVGTGPTAPHIRGTILQTEGVRPRRCSYGEPVGNKGGRRSGTNRAGKRREWGLGTAGGKWSGVR